MHHHIFFGWSVISSTIIDIINICSYIVYQLLQKPIFEPPTPNSPRHGTAEKSADKIWLMCKVGSAESLLFKLKKKGTEGK